MVTECSTLVLSGSQLTFFCGNLGAEYLVFVSSRSLKTREKYINWDKLSCLSLYIFLLFWGNERRQKPNIPHPSSQNEALTRNTSTKFQKLKSAGFLFRILLPFLKNSMVIYFLDAGRIMDLLDLSIRFREPEVLSYYVFKWKKS